MLSIRCPFCDSKLSVPELLVGKSGRCTKCRERFTVPRPALRAQRTKPVRTRDGSPFLEDDDNANADDLEVIEDVDESLSLEVDDDPCRITVEPGFPDVPRKILNEVSQALGNRMRAAPAGTFQETDLFLSIDKYDPGSRLMRYLLPFFAGAAKVAISINGTVNGAPIDASTRAARYAGLFGGDSQKMLDTCLQDCLGNILLAIWAASGHEPPPFARFWNYVRIARWIAAALATICYAAAFAAFRMQNPGRNGAGAELFMLIFTSLIMAGSMLGIVTLGTLLAAPADFLREDPRGIKIMSRAGVKNPWAMKILAAILLFISCGAIGLCLLALLEAK